MGRTKQGGSILGYVIIGGVLLLLLLAGAYALRNYWSGKPTQVAQKPKDTSSQQAKPQTDGTTGNSSSNQQSSTPAAPATPAPSASSNPAPSATQLPQTGPIDTVLSASIFAIIVMTLGVYLQSRRLDASL